MFLLSYLAMLQCVISFVTYLGPYKAEKKTVYVILQTTLYEMQIQ